MWVEELQIENIRCFESCKLKFSMGSDSGYRWVTFLGENGGGKSTALQTLALLLAGPEGALQLESRPLGWVRNEDRPGKISTRIHQDSGDAGQHGKDKIRRAFSYSYHLTGTKHLTIGNKLYTEAAIVPAGNQILTWLRENAFPSKGEGWFAVGYGAFRRLTRLSQIIVPSLEPQARFKNFLTQFNESEPLSVFEKWMVYVDYRIAKAKDEQARRFKELGVNAINRLLPKGAKFDSVTSEGRILFDVTGQKVPTIALSDGYRSVLALVGDLVWRLLQSFPKSDDPLSEQGVVLIDELDIHLHPIWQRDIAGHLRSLFPKLQFFVATHSPLVAAGAGEDALTLQFQYEGGVASVEKVKNIAALNVDRILQSQAFGLVSPYSPETQRRIDRYDALRRKRTHTPNEQLELKGLSEFIGTARPFGGPPTPGSLEEKMDAFLKENLK